MRAGDPQWVLAELGRKTAARLRERREEIYEAVTLQAFRVAPPSGKEAPGYVEALRAAIPEAIDHAFHAIEVGEERIGPTPAAALAQAAASARSGVGLEVVMRRYAAGYSTISDFLHQEVRRQGEEARGFPNLQRELTALFGRVVVDVAETYRREGGTLLLSPRRPHLERIHRLLAGDLVDRGGFDYPFEGYHLALIVSGPSPEAGGGGDLAGAPPRSPRAGRRELKRALRLLDRRGRAVRPRRGRGCRCCRRVRWPPPSCDGRAGRRARRLAGDPVPGRGGPVGSGTLGGDDRHICSAIRP
jgi:hypothetical protein